LKLESPRSISSYDRIDDPMSNGVGNNRYDKQICGVKMSCSEFQSVEMLYIFLPALPHVVARGILS
jgi:hypothetical protein